MVARSDRFESINPTVYRYIAEDRELSAELENYESLNRLERLSKIVSTIIVPRLNLLEVKLLDISERNKGKEVPRRVDGEQVGKITIDEIFNGYARRLADRKKQLAETPLNSAYDHEAEMNDRISDMFYFAVSTFSALANIANDIRHHFRTEIGEYRHKVYDHKRVGSSTMPHKQNPVEYEQVVSLWKTQVPRLVSAVMSQVVEHQSDSTNLALPGYTLELHCILAYAAKKLEKAIGNLGIN